MTSSASMPAISEQRSDPATPSLRAFQEGDRQDPFKGYLRIQDASVAPFGCICHLEITDQDGGSFFGTGFLIARRMVLTSAHNLFDKDKQRFVEKVVVTAGREGNRGSVARFEVGKESLHVPEEGKVPNEGGIILKNPEWDFGIVVLPEAASDIGHFQLASRSASSLQEANLVVVGYAGFRTGVANEPLGTIQFGINAGVRKIKNGVLHTTVSGAGGISGAPIWIRDEENRIRVVAIAKGGLTLLGDRLIAVHVRDEVTAFVDQVAETIED